MTRAWRATVGVAAAATVLAVPALASAQYGYSAGYHFGPGYVYANPYAEYGYNPYGYGGFDGRFDNDNWYFDYYDARRVDESYDVLRRPTSLA